MIKYILFEKSAVKLLVNNTALQSIEFPLSVSFINFLREENNELSLKDIVIKKDKEGIYFCGNELSKTFLTIDIEKSKLLELTNDYELLIILQKSFRFALRFWNKQAFTNSERIIKDKTAIYPFPFSVRSSYRIVIARNPIDKRLEPRGIKDSLFAYKYGDEDIASLSNNTPDLANFRKSGEGYLDIIQEARREFLEQKKKISETEIDEHSIHIFASENMVSSSEFKFMNFDKQINNLTLSQKNIVYCTDYHSPIRVEGPAGTGKTAALILRAIKMLKDATEKDEELSIVFFTHSKSTESAVQHMISQLATEKWLMENNSQRILITTLQEYCMQYIGLKETQIIDLDASEAKQNQLLLIDEAFQKLRGSVLSTYKPLMSEKAITFFENEDINKIVIMLQHEFSIRIKGMAECDIDRYKKLSNLDNGIPLEVEADKDFVFRIFREYQQMLEILSVYDTDDIILEASARLNGPLWRRARIKDGLDYLFVDEMHLFNLNEQQVFHYLTKDVNQEIIPICFALDYAQVIGERGNISENYIEKNLSNGQTLQEELSTVFRSSQQIAELCASITASGALLFQSFINPYKFCESGFTAKEEELCETPTLIMYENDLEMKASLEKHIKSLTNKYKCSPCDIALIFFDEEMLFENYRVSVGKYPVTYIDGREQHICNYERTNVVCSLPEYINGLEYKCVILVGIDDGRVPQTGIYDISSNFLKYSALNKLYLCCSRAQFNVTMLGTKTRGISSCLEHSIANKTLHVTEK